MIHVCKPGHDFDSIKALCNILITQLFLVLHKRIFECFGICVAPPGLGDCNSFPTACAVGYGCYTPMGCLCHAPLGATQP